LLHALQSNSPKKRETFFKSLMLTRNRDKQVWSDTPLSKAFTNVDEYHLLKQRALTTRLRTELDKLGLSLL
jgi:hypothetical protein